MRQEALKGIVEVTLLQCRDYLRFYYSERIGKVKKCFPKGSVASILEVNMMAFADNKQSLQLDAAALTDRGRRRKVNEDAIFHKTGQTENGERVGLYMVCDGLGGHQAGEVASQLAIETVASQLTELLFSCEPATNSERTSPSHPTVRNQIQTAITRANARIRHYAQTHNQQVVKLGTTITLALIYGKVAYIANVGDSRVYIYRAGQLIQITRDHSLAAKMARMGKIDESEIVTHPRRNMLYRSLGSQDDQDLEVDLFEWDLQSGDKLLLCSDGLWQPFPGRAELAKWLGAAAAPEEICRQLVSEANRRDGADNISAVVVNIEEDPNQKTKFMHSIAGVFREAVVN